MDLWQEARAKHEDPVEAWASIVEDRRSPRALSSSAGKRGIPTRQLGRVP